jgi:hypothetical protein
MGGADVAARANSGGGQCNEANLTPQVVGPCDTTFGQSVF